MLIGPLGPPWCTIPACNRKVTASLVACMPFIVAEFTDDGTFIEVGRRAPEGAWQGATQVASSELSGQGNATSMSRVTMGEGGGAGTLYKARLLISLSYSYQIAKAVL